MSRSSKTCKACGSTGGLTKHHVYPRYLRDIWKDRVEQAIALLCRTCHDVVHYREGRYGARRAKKYEYVRLFSDVNAQKVLGKYRKIIRTLERASKALHVTGNVDEELMAFFQDFCIKT